MFRILLQQFSGKGKRNMYSINLQFDKCARKAGNQAVVKLRGITSLSLVISFCVGWYSSNLLHMFEQLSMKCPLEWNAHS